ncbi:MAG: serine/threonine protein kinase, partial [Aeromicrobium sp.]|nr:serine/threonine protein kinase [Aeromicrobium sp.]
MPPTTIAGRYAVERAVGRGGMGTVWLCRDEVLGRLVAVKEVGSLPGTSTSDLARALREARNSAALNHRNVVSIFDAVEDGDRNWLVMEYVPSRTLSEIVAEEGAMPPERVAWVGAQAADGLAAAHQRGTMHRDVKPGNILVTDDYHVKISDFGIARTHGDDQLTRTGVVTGTPAYFAPELAKGQEPSMAADVWGLGASLYAAVEGRLPYPEHSNAIALLTRIASGPPIPPEKAGFLTEPIARMMDPDPTTRWTMADAAHALHRLHERHGIRSSGPITASFAAPSAAAAGVPTEKTGLPTEATELPTEATPPPLGVEAPRPVAASGPPPPAPPAPPASRGSQRRRMVLAAAVLLVAIGGLGTYLLSQGDGGQSAKDSPSSSQSAGSDETPDDTAPDEATPDGTGTGDAA